MAELYTTQQHVDLARIPARASQAEYARGLGLDPRRLSGYLTGAETSEGVALRLADAGVPTCPCGNGLCNAEYRPAEGGHPAVVMAKGKHDAARFRAAARHILDQRGEPTSWVAKARVRRQVWRLVAHHKDGRRTFRPERPEPGWTGPLCPVTVIEVPGGGS